MPLVALLRPSGQVDPAGEGLERALDALSGKFTDAIMRKLNQEVDLKHREPAAVAKDFLASVSL